MLKEKWVDEFVEAATSADESDLARAALVIARLEYPRLNTTHYLDVLDSMGAGASERLERPTTRGPHGPIEALNRYLFGEQGFAGNRESYDDPRNSFLNEVLERRTGIPVTLALVYIEVARRAGVRIEGVNFPGRFLLRYDGQDAFSVIIDPFNGGVVLSEADCRDLLQQHLGEDAAFNDRMLAPATKQQILVRMLGNLKRIFVRLHSFPQARDVTELLVAIDSSAPTELRDRGLLAYHLRDYSGALRDLERYLLLTGRSGQDEEIREEHKQIWEHIKALRRRVASFN